MKKNTLFNKVFYSKEVKASKKKYELSKKLVGLGPETLQYVEGAQTLKGVLAAHQMAWARGYQNENLGPCEYGMFRTKDILKMTPSEVYLGNIWGLWTFNIPSWEQRKEATMAGNGFGLPGETKIYDLILRQYKTLVRKNVEKLIREASDYIKKYEQ